MGEEKDGGQNQAYMKRKGHDGQDRMPSHILSGKGRDPSENGAETVSPTHVGEDEFFFFTDQHEHRDQPIEAAPNKQDEGRPCQRTGYENV